MLKNNIYFNISERKVLLRLFDIISTLILLYLVSVIFDFDYFTISEENWHWVFVFVIYLSVFGSVFELYDLQKASKIQTVYANIILTVSTTVLFYLLTPFYTPVLPENRLQIIFFFCSILLALFIWRLIYIQFIISPRFHKKVLIIGEASNIQSIVDTFKLADLDYKIIGFINCEDKASNKEKLIDIVEYSPRQIYQVIKDEGVSEILIASHHTASITSDIYQDLITLLGQGLSIREYTQVYEELMDRIPVEFIERDFYKYFPFSGSHQNKLFSFFQTFFGVLISSLGIIIGIALLPLIFIGNLIGNRGALFYAQERVGKDGRLFKIIKFRTMIENAEINGAVWAKKNDDRITFFGKFLRNTRIDEIPQFINILKGDMNLIGPRPERLKFVLELSKVLPFYETRHIIKPGLTGWAQVKTRYASNIDDNLLKLQYDLFYIKHRSFFLDIAIVVKTLSSVIYFRGQ